MRDSIDYTYVVDIDYQTDSAVHQWPSMHHMHLSVTVLVPMDCINVKYTVL